MSCIRAKDIMHPRVSLQAKEKGSELVKKLMCGYPGLPVVNEINALAEQGFWHEHEFKKRV